MSNTKFRSVLSLFLALILALTLFIAFIPVQANAVTQSEIDDLKEQQSSLKEQQKDIQSTINSLKGQQDKLIELKTALDQKNAITLQQIQVLEEQIALHEDLIAQKAKEVDETQKLADEQLVKLKKRIRSMEENGRYSYIEVLFGANSIGEFLGLIDDVGDIMKSDRELEDSYKSTVTDLKAAKAEYEQAQLEMKEQKAELTKLSAQLESDIAEATALISSLQSDISSNSALLSQLNAQDEALRNEISAKSKELAEEARREQEKNNNGGNSGGQVIGTGSLMWPSYCTTISSRKYGYYPHPITGQYKLHGGIDICASNGTAILAADSGTVVKSVDGWNGGWGNYVMINHGNGLQTLYAHMSSRAVSTGHQVSRGQTIGYVGSTGMSTGPHLHFEVWLNGSRTDPLNYFAAGTYTVR